MKGTPACERPSTVSTQPVANPASALTSTNPKILIFSFIRW
jgi:hypothetical protein